MTPDPAAVAQPEAFVEAKARALFEALGLPCRVEAKPRPAGAREPVRLQVTPDAGDLLGARRWTQVSQAAGVLLEMALLRAGVVDLPVAVTLPDQLHGPPRPTREALGLDASARALAESAAARGRAFALGPMSVGDRRLVHQALGEVEGVWTQSAGEGIFRRLWVVPRPASAPEEETSPDPSSAGEPSLDEGEDAAGA